MLNEIMFPEFSPTQKVDKKLHAHIHDESSPCDIIMGTDLLIPLGIDVQSSTQTIKWNNNLVPWKSRDCLKDSLSQDPNQMEAHAFFVDTDADDCVDLFWMQRITV